MARKIFCDICDKCVNHWYEVYAIVEERSYDNE